MFTRFLYNAALWDEIQRRVREAKNVQAAVAYFASGGANLLPLKKGDRLVVDMSMKAVKSGVTDPKEIRKLIKRHVKVFTRSSLHAKFLVADKALIVGSANISHLSRAALDEAGGLTTDHSAVRRAADFIDSMSTEPVRPEYLKKCIEAYRPPKFDLASQKPRGGRRRKRVTVAKVWFIGGLVYGGPPEAETTQVNAAQRRAEKKLREPIRTEVDFIHYPEPIRSFDMLRVGDWVVPCLEDETKRRYVWAPEQFLGLESYPRGRGKRRYLLMLEKARSAKQVTLGEFRKRIRTKLPALDSNRPRTRPIANDTDADFILRLWTPAGRLVRRRKRRK